jgi:hypothetical protein
MFGDLWSWAMHLCHHLHHQVWLVLITHFPSSWLPALAVCVQKLQPQYVSFLGTVWRILSAVPLMLACLGCSNAAAYKPHGQFCSSTWKFQDAYAWTRSQLTLVVAACPTSPPLEC